MTEQGRVLRAFSIIYQTGRGSRVGCSLFANTVGSPAAWWVLRAFPIIYQTGRGSRVGCSLFATHVGSLPAWQTVGAIAGTAKAIWPARHLTCPSICTTPYVSPTRAGIVSAARTACGAGGL